MPAVARSNYVDNVFSPHGLGYKCRSPSTQTTDEGASKVFAQGTLVVVDDNKMIQHNMPNCIPHSPIPTLDSGSSKVFVEGKGIARIGDIYGGEHPIISGCSKVFSG
jgi:hypothetical protein